MNQPITIHPWMLHDLHLQGNTLLIFALQHQTGRQYTVTELMQFFGISRRTVFNCLRDIKRVQQLAPAVQESAPAVQKTALNECKVLHFSKDKESNKEKEKENSTTSSPAREENEKMIFSWLTDNDESMRVLCMNNHLSVGNPQAHDELVAALQPYMQEFVKGLIECGEDFYVKGRADTKKHFAAWLPKYRLKQQTARTTNFSRFTPPPLTPEQAAEDQLKKRRRLEHAAEQLAQLDRQAADSQSSDAQAAAADFFRKHSINNKKR